MDTSGIVKQTPETQKTPVVEVTKEQLPSNEIATEEPSMKEVVQKVDTESASSGTATQDAQNAPPYVVPQDERRKKIERILEDGLRDAYGTLPDAIKSSFLAKGEEVAGKIREMIDGGAVIVKKIIQWIREWLQMIPGINRFYLEQETKIKADRILFLVEEERGERPE